MESMPTEGLAALRCWEWPCVEKEDEKEGQAGGRLLELAWGSEDVILTLNLKGGVVTPWAGNCRC